MNETAIQIGGKVRRVTSPNDYTNDRTGTVVDIDTVRGRARVLWTHEKNGHRIHDPLRTWVKFAGLAATENAEGQQ